MTMGGYDPKAIIDRDGTNFFEDWVSKITGKIAYSDPIHPGPKERAEFLRAQLGPVVEVLNYFTFGVRLYQLGSYSDAILLKAFRKARAGGFQQHCPLSLSAGDEALFACDKHYLLDSSS
jgi:hypothetical protein